MAAELDVPQKPELLKPDSLLDPAGKLNCSEFGKASETGLVSAIITILPFPIVLQAFKAAEVPGVTCWNARFCSTNVRELRDIHHK